MKYEVGGMKYEVGGKKEGRRPSYFLLPTSYFLLLTSYFLLLTSSLLLHGCVSHPSSDMQRSYVREWMAPNGKVKALSTIAMIGDLVKQVGGEHVDSLTLIKGNLDPHSYQLVKGDNEKLAFADLIFYNGLGLEHGPSLQRYLEQSEKTVGLGDKVGEKFPQEIIVIDGQVDPHIWMDISLWEKTVEFIVAALAQKDPEHAPDYHANGEDLVKEMRKAHEEVRQQLQAIPSLKRFLVTSHDAFNYFARAYLAEANEATPEEWQKRFVAPEGLAPESQLSATDIQETIDHLARYQIHVLFPESNVSRDSIRKIVQAGREKGLELMISEIPLYGDAMGPPGSDGDTYLKMIKHNSFVISHYLKANQ